MSLNIDPQIEHDLAELAGMKNISVNTLLREFTVDQKRYWKERAEDKARLEKLKKGGGIAHNDMMDWVDNLATGKTE